MRYVEVDREGNLILTYEVSVECHGRRVRHLGTGSSAVHKFCEIIENEGIPEAKEIKCLWMNNYLVTISGEGLLSFLERHYPNEVHSGRKIDPDEEYVIDCYDMS